MFGVFAFSLALATTLFTDNFAVGELALYELRRDLEINTLALAGALLPNARREFPLSNATRTLDTPSLGPSHSSTTTNNSRALITPSPILNSNSTGIFNNASFAVCSAIAASRQGRPFKRNAGSELLSELEGSFAFKRDARNCDMLVLNICL